MSRVSINGLLKPKTATPAANAYLGHFVKVGYQQLIEGNPIYSLDRVEVAENGSFRFFLPKGELLSEQSIKLQVYAPDGQLLGSQIYSYGSLYPSEIDPSAQDNSKAFELEVDPKQINFGDAGPVANSHNKITGKLVDLSGSKKVGGLQVLVMAATDAHAEVGSKGFSAVFSALTDAGGYFSGKVKNTSYGKAYACIAGLEGHFIPFELDDQKIPAQLLLVADLTDLPEGVAVSAGTPNQPDGVDLVRNPSFSQDLGGRCIDFTVPNRTLEEFSFYQTVRTTEPEIKGLTINASETRNLKVQMLEISDEMFAVFGRLKESLSSMHLVEYTVDEDETQGNLSTYISHEDAKKAAISDIYQKPVYRLKVASGLSHLKMSTRDLGFEKKGLDFVGVINILAEQGKRKQKLDDLHRKLAAAYCGKKGWQEAGGFCDQYVAKDVLNREKVNALLGHIKKYDKFVSVNAALAKSFKGFGEDAEAMLKLKTADSGLLSVMKTRTEKLLADVDVKTTESQDQEELLGYLRRMVKELDQAVAGAYDFEPCPPPKKIETIGIMCLLQEFEQTRDLLRNKSVFTLGEIYKLRANYEKYAASIRSFLSLLDQYYSFYHSGPKMFLTLENDYFIEQYSQIKSALNNLKRQVGQATRKIEDIERAYINNHPGRRELTVEYGVDWDETPTVYENTTIAHGHILHFKQAWKADGYSLGDLLYSLPLAPCQEKQIAIIDWDRSERAARTESQDVSEAMQADISHDRDISEIISSSFREDISANSYNKTKSTSAGLGGGIFGSIGGLFGGVAHSGATSSSSANQNSARSLSASSLSRLQDNVSQSASSLRTQRNTVIQTVGQNENMTVQTEVVRNNNHCHALTVEYFEVLKHYAIEQRLVDVQECLFVPLPMSVFDHAKILRWKNTLRRAVYGAQLQRGFDAIERIANNYADSDLPTGTYADEPIEDLHGNFSLTFDLKRPYISEIDEATKTETIVLSNHFPWFFGAMKWSIDREVPLTEAEKDALFERDFAPDIVRSFIDKIEVYAIDGNGTEVPLELDFTLLSTYRRNVPLQVSIAPKSIPTLSRSNIKHLRFRAGTVVKPESKIILRSFYLYYRTRHLSESIIRNAKVNNDVINTVEVQISFPAIQIVQKTDAALLYTPMNARELRNPRKEDREAANALTNFLNEHMEMAHKAIWSAMDSSRLFGLLDGYIAPNSGSRSVASVVDNKIMGIVGNNLVLKVVPGERLDPVFKNVEDLLAYYQPTTEPDPFRISVPTKGVYAEAVLGRCNSCEVIDESRHWRFDEAPCGCSGATPIQPISTDSRRSDTGDMQVKDLPSSIINMQNAPSAPDPTGLGAAFSLLGQSNAFKDMTGLAGTQANAIKALETTSKSVTDLAGMAVDLKKQEAMKKDIDRTMKSIQEAEGSGQITKEQANQLRMRALGALVGEPTKRSTATSSTNDVKELTKTAGENKAAVKVNKPGGEQIEVDARIPDSSANTAVGIQLSAATGTAENRAFNPSINDKSGCIELEALVSNAPAGATYRWSAANPQNIIVEQGNTTRALIKALRPGRTDVRFEVFDNGGALLASKSFGLSAPQFVTVGEDQSAFDGVLADYMMDDVKEAVVEHAKQVCDHLLNKANVRTIWQLGGYNEALPAHLPAGHFTKATFRGNPPKPNLLGETKGPGGAAVLNEIIEIYPGAYDDPIPVGDKNVDVDVETQALVMQLKSANFTDVALKQFAIKVFGRLFGETLAHEIVHSLLWMVIPTGHNAPTVPNDLMNNGFERHFSQRTGIEDTAYTSPVEPDNFVDHGIAAIGGLQSTNQSRIDNHFPVPSAFN